MIRSGGCCEVCLSGATATQVHHVSYANLGNEDVNADLLAVCRPCHDGISHRPNAPASGKPDGATWRQLEQLALTFNRLPQFNRLLA